MPPLPLPIAYSVGGLQRELTGDQDMAAKAISDTIDKRLLAQVRWTRALDSKLRTACAGLVRGAPLACCKDPLDNGDLATNRRKPVENTMAIDTLTAEGAFVRPAAGAGLGGGLEVGRPELERL